MLINLTKLINKLKLAWYRFWLSSVEGEIEGVHDFIWYAKENNVNFDALHRAKHELDELRNERLVLISKIARLER